MKKDDIINFKMTAAEFDMLVGIMDIGHSFDMMDNIGFSHLADTNIRYYDEMREAIDSLQTKVFDYYKKNNARVDWEHK